MSKVGLDLHQRRLAKRPRVAALDDGIALGAHTAALAPVEAAVPFAPVSLAAIGAGCG